MQGKECAIVNEKHDGQSSVSERSELQSGVRRTTAGDLAGDGLLDDNVLSVPMLRNAFFKHP